MRSNNTEVQNILIKEYMSKYIINICFKVFE